MKLLKNIHNLKAKRVLVRVDFNVPIIKDKILDDTKIKANLLTIEFLIKKQAKLILISHLGDIGEASKVKSLKLKVKSFGLKPVAKYLEKLLAKKVTFVSDCIGTKVKKAVKALKPGQVLLLENLRFHPEEENNCPDFAKKLACLGDIYVNDAFAVSHRSHASLVGVPKHLPSYAGLLLAREIEVLSKTLKRPKKPLVVLLGGAKVSTKIGVIKNFLKIANQVLLGGGLANTFFKAKGYQVGKSLIDKKEISFAKSVLKNKKIILPLDVVVAKPRKQEITKNTKADAQIKSPKELKASEAVFDIGPATILEYASYIRKAQTIIWNGPMGYFEIPTFSHGSIALARFIASRSKGKAFGVVGGGETLLCLEKTKMAEFVDHISTGGGAMLDFLAGENLPGIEALI